MFHPNGLGKRVDLELLQLQGGGELWDAEPKVLCAPLGGAAEPRAAVGAPRRLSTGLRAALHAGEVLCGAARGGASSAAEGRQAAGDVRHGGPRRRRPWKVSSDFSRQVVRQKDYIFEFASAEDADIFCEDRKELSKGPLK